MKRYMLLHCGFEKPTPDIMVACGKWFAAEKLAQGNPFIASIRIDEIQSH